MKVHNNMRLRRLENSSIEMHVCNSNLIRMMTNAYFSSAKKSFADTTTWTKVETEKKFINTKKPWKLLLNLECSIRTKPNSSYHPKMSAVLFP
jgi:hypothetical protein